VVLLRAPLQAVAAKADAVGTRARSEGSHEGVATIVIATGEKQLKQLRMERAQRPSGEPSPGVEAFFAVQHAVRRPATARAMSTREERRRQRIVRLLERPEGAASR
jgi:hypothetical protein